MGCVDLLGPSPESSGKGSYCNPVRCGWICVDCKAKHKSVQTVVFSKCISPSGKHGYRHVVESRYVCDTCYELADRAEDLKGKVCGGPPSPPAELNGAVQQFYKVKQEETAEEEERKAEQSPAKVPSPEPEASRPRPVARPSTAPGVPQVPAAFKEPAESALEPSSEPKDVPRSQEMPSVVTDAARDKKVEELKEMEREIARLQRVKQIQAERAQLAKLLAMKNQRFLAEIT